MARAKATLRPSKSSIPKFQILYKTSPATQFNERLSHTCLISCMTEFIDLSFTMISKRRARRNADDIISRCFRFRSETILQRRIVIGPSPLQRVCFTSYYDFVHSLHIQIGISLKQAACVCNSASIFYYSLEARSTSLQI